MHRTQKMYFLRSNNFYLKHFFLTSIFIKIIFKKWKFFEFFEVLTLKMTLSAIIIIIFIISAPKYSNILINNKIRELSLSKLHPIVDYLYYQLLYWLFIYMFYMCTSKYVTSKGEGTYFLEGRNPTPGLPTFHKIRSLSLHFSPMN